MPREERKGSSDSPLTRIERVDEEMQDMMRSIQSLGKLNQFST